ncbi:uncharacterized protein LOC115383163 isoform X4 [Salarias fasciatus]|uniref:uncharacterized protein LOC115383163 isoform X4 n=1 Tax=Salarias fasciatus TaxID=181472 RepID=UPI001176A909|nr:zinc finger protein 883 isoform X4 [Salarias fasciatus]
MKRTLSERSSCRSQKRSYSMDQEELDYPQIKIEVEDSETLQIKVEHEDPETRDVEVDEEETEMPQVKEEDEEVDFLQVKEEEEELLIPQVKQEEEGLEIPQVEEEGERRFPLVKTEANDPGRPQIKDEEDIFACEDRRPLALKQETDDFLQMRQEISDYDAVHLDELEAAILLPSSKNPKMAEPIDKRDQRTSIRCCFLLGKTATETLTMIQTAYKDEALGRSQVFEWYGRFKSGQMSIEDSPRSGRPSTSRTEENVRKIEAVVMADRRRTIDEIEHLTGISWSSCQRILREDLGLRRVAAKMVPRFLTTEQKQARVDMCQELKRQLEDDGGLFEKIITGDEIWCYGYDPETKQQSTQRRHQGPPRPKKARQVRSAIKTMLICFFDIKGMVHSEFVPPGQTVNQDFYLEVLRRLQEAVRLKRPALWESGDWWLHHDNAPAHRALRVKQFLMKNGMALLPHPLYSPDLAPCDFFLFPRMKKALKGRRFDDVEEVQKKSKQALKRIFTREYADCFEQWKSRLQRCIQAEGEYFEGDSFD